MIFDHIGVTAAGLAAGRSLLESSIGVRCWTEAFEDGVNDVWVQFGQCASGVCYELVAPLSERSPIRHVLSKKINVLNHLAYRVADLAPEAARLSAAGFAEVAPARPAIAYGGARIQFFVARNRLLLELIEAPDHQHRFMRTA